jgi:hypothetical protein
LFHDNNAVAGHPKSSGIASLRAQVQLRQSTVTNLQYDIVNLARMSASVHFDATSGHGIKLVFAGGTGCYAVVGSTFTFDPIENSETMRLKPGCHKSRGYSLNDAVGRDQFVLPITISVDFPKN